MGDQAYDEAEEASSLLQMARKLHEQHVSSAREEAARIIAHAQLEASQLVSNAKAESEQTLQDAQAELVSINEAIAKSREFESTYRNSIKKYLHELLDDVTDEEEPVAQPHVVVVPAPPVVAAVEPKPAAEEESVPAFEAAPSFDNGGLTEDAFDKLTEPDASAEDVEFTPETPAAIDEPVDAEVEAPAEVASFPSFNSEPEAALDNHASDTVEDLLAAEDANEQEAEAELLSDVEAPEVTDEAPAESDTAPAEEEIDKLLNSISNLPGAEVDNDGGTSSDTDDEQEEDAAPADLPVESIADEGADEASEIDESDTEAEAQTFESSNVESFNEILSTSSAANETDETQDKEEKPKFSFFGSKK